MRHANIIIYSSQQDHFHFSGTWQDGRFRPYGHTHRNQMSHCPWVVAYKENIDMVPQLMGHILAIAPPKLFLNNRNALSIAS